jgi:hypothetical protein
MPELFSAALRDPAVASLILSPFTIPQLCDIALTCKDVHAQLMPHIWSDLVFWSPIQAFRALFAITSNPAIGPHIRTLKMQPARQHAPLYSEADTKTIYTAFARALPKMINLEQMFIDDITASVLHPNQQDTHSWIVPSRGEIKGLSLLCYGILWDATLDAFLDAQTNLQWFSALLCTPSYNPSPPPDPMPWPRLAFAEVDVNLAHRVCNAPLRTLVIQLHGAEKSADDILELLGNVLPRLAGHRTLRGLAIRSIVKRVVPNVAAATAQALPHLKYFGVVQLSPLDVGPFLPHLPCTAHD